MPLPRRITRILTILGGVLLLGWTGACGGPVTAPAGPDTPGDPAVVTPAPEPQPISDGQCPYLDRQTVERANGQRVSSVRLSADQPYPACFFYRGDGGEQLRTWVVVATPQVAGATVDAVAPVATSDLAELPGGWSGGTQPTPEGAVIAVARQDTAIIITTNQSQTAAARRIAERVIAALGL